MNLPTEITIHILSYLPLSTLLTLLRVSHRWYNLIDGDQMNKETIYRNAAFFEGYSPRRTMLLEELGPRDGEQIADVRKALYSSRALSNVSSWKDFCKRRKMIQRAWTGRAPSRVVPSPRPPSNSAKTQQPEPGVESLHYRRVLRFKVDEKVGITMATTELGGLIVRDLETDMVLWELPVWYVRGYSHLEYGEGFMIFDRDDGNKEVWRRTADIPVPPCTTGNFAATNLELQTEPEPELDPSSSPDGRQLHVSHLTTFRLLNSKAHFTPHAILHTPQPSSAFRFVYPHLLVASLERAFVWDVRTGKIVETVEGIQLIRTGGGGDHEDEESEGHVPLFLGRVRYVDISPRHVFFAGGTLLRVFSRATGECVLDIPSTRWRYGRWRWEVASRASNKPVGVGQGIGRDGVKEKGSYAEAKEKGREVVRMPTRSSLEEHLGGVSGRQSADHFIAVHVSGDGKHLVALLSGSRLVIMHHFEALLPRRSSPPPPNIFLPTPRDAVASTSTIFSPAPPTKTAASALTAAPSLSTSQQSPEQHKRAQKRSSARRRHDRQVLREAEKRREREQQEQEEEIYKNTLDVQLGPPSVSSSIYLAYEDGRIGVVTTSAVYIVIPIIPSLPPSSPSRPSNLTLNNGAVSSSLNHPNAQPKSYLPKALDLSIFRVPYFSNPSWLSAVTCLMMSDTGLYLNWNPTWPRERLGAGGHGGAWGAGRGVGIGRAAANTSTAGVVGANVGGGPGVGLGFEPENSKEKEMMMDRWERQYEQGLKLYKNVEDGRYSSESLLALLSGGLSIMLGPGGLEDLKSEISTIYRVDFIPLPSSPISPPPVSMSSSQQVTEGDLASVDGSPAVGGTRSRKRKAKATRGRR